MTLKAAMNLFFFTDENEARQFLKDLLHWEIGRDGRVYTKIFDDDRSGEMDVDDVDGPVEPRPNLSLRIGPQEMMENMLDYATVLEAIV